MNTTARGDVFEAQIHEAISQMVDGGQFFVSKDCCRIFRKKGYYSKDRGRDIIFDVSIEIFLPGSDERSLLVLIECKNYGSRVPVDDIEEFFAKTQQISPAGVKAIVASTNSFQDGAFAFAKAKGIGLLRYFSADSLEWVLRRSPSSAGGIEATTNAYYALHRENFTSSYFDCYCFFDEQYGVSLPRFFHQILGDEIRALGYEQDANVGHPARLVPFLARSEIERICSVMRSRVDYVGGTVPLERIFDSVEGTHSLRVETANLPTGTLGTVVFSPPLIQIDRAQAENSRRIRFTLAHELGHFMLGHGEYMARDVCHERDVDVDSPPEISVRDLARMEWQANHFAACLLLPADHLTTAIQREIAARNIVDRGHGPIFLDSQSCNRETFFSLTSPIVQKFDVSRSVVRIRLAELGFLQEI